MTSEPGDQTGKSPPRLPELLELHALPTRYMDPTWWQPDWLPEQLFERLKCNPRSHRHLSRFFLKHTEPSHNSPFRGEPAHADLALIPRQRLNRLTFLAGVTLLSPTIARVLRRQDRSRIRDSIGESDYDFAIRRGRFLLQQARLSDRIEDNALTDLSEVDDQCRRLGVGSLAAALQEAPQALVHRTRLKLPRKLAERHWQPLGTPSQAFARLFGLLDRQVQKA